VLVNAFGVSLDDAKANVAGWQAVQQCFIKGYY
jgi:hypothetical protein